MIYRRERYSLIEHLLEQFIDLSTSITSVKLYDQSVTQFTSLHFTNNISTVYQLNLGPYQKSGPFPINTQMLMPSLASTLILNTTISSNDLPHCNR